MEGARNGMCKAFWGAGLSGASTLNSSLKVLSQNEFYELEELF